MSVLSVFDGSARALEIVKIVSRHEWSFLSQLLGRGDSAETCLSLPSEQPSLTCFATTPSQLTAVCSGCESGCESGCGGGGCGGGGGAATLFGLA